MSTPAAVLWDLDGTLVDTEPLWMAEEAAVAAEHGVEWTEQDGLELVGNALLDSGRILQRKLSSPLTPEEIVDRLVVRLADSLRGDIPWRPGLPALVEEVATAGIPQALVTMSYAQIAAPVAEVLPFDAVVTGDVVARGKPDPEPYLEAARRLGVDPRDCLAVEDSPTGAASANAAGCVVLVVPHLVAVPLTPRRVVRKGLEVLDATELFDLWASRSADRLR
ncbi:HAD family phosphatase [Aeromicrobium halocynthiae]|uniref:HAD family phosphatase n=1 Tax=Aeromicrobium halocynthiae TaxID=560557 RepID=A0ABN2VQN7_9ACTN